MTKKFIFIISFLVLFIFLFYFETSYSKYVLEEIYTVATINIDRCPPTIEMVSAYSSNAENQLCISNNDIITIRIKIIEKNIAIDRLSFDNLVITVAGNTINPTFKNLSVISEISGEKVYELSFYNVTGSGPLKFQIPQGLIEDISGSQNEANTFSTGILVHNKK